MKIHTMTIKQTVISWAKIVFIAILLTCVHAVKADFSDDFSSSTLDTGWRFYDPYDTDGTPGNESGESTLTHTGQNLLISIPQGLTHDLWKTPLNKAPRLLQSMGNNDFTIEVKFETEPNAETQQQGIIVQESDTVFLRFNIHYTPSEPRLFIGYVNGSSGSALKSIALNTYPKYQQVIRSVNTWTYRYSSDGTNWTTGATVSRSLAVTEVGFFAGTSSSNPAFVSSVDYFMDSTDPIIDTDEWIAPPPVINAWYDYAGSSLGFGLPGTSQQQANILGNVFSDTDITALTYNINGVLEQALSLGANGFRLENKGDFNIEIDPADLGLGSNSVTIKATDTHGSLTTKSVAIDYSSAIEWPLPYLADWSSLADVQNVENIAHIVDGLWKLTADGIRTVQNGYDRTIAIGDMTWSTDYEVTVPITIHSGFTGVGVAVGWQGHINHQDLNMSPKVGWPIQALAWIRGPLSNPTLEIVTYGAEVPANQWEVTETVEPQHQITIVKNTKYMLKTRSESLTDGTSQFYVKLWPESSSEPGNWDINANIPTRNGSVLLVAFKVDATFGNVSIEPLTVVSDAIAPVIDNIQVTVTDTTATITWDTNEVADSLVDYGLTNAYGSIVNNTSLVTSHTLTLTNLTASTDYHFRVSSTDGSNNTSSSTDMVLTTAAPDTTVPLISNIQTIVTDTTATITWDTNEVADSLIDYGLTSAYDSTVNSATLVTSHSLTLTGLAADTEYHYQVSSADGSSNIATSIDLTLTTNSMPTNLSGMVSDNFDGLLNTGLWTFYDPLGDSTLSTTGTQVSISVPVGIKHDLWKNALDAPRIRQAANDTDFEVEVKFDSVLLNQYQLQGITVEQDSTNLLRFDFYSDGAATYIFSTSFANGKPSIHTNLIIADGVPLYLRVKREGDQWTISSSYDGSSWTVAGVYTHNLSVTSVGLFAGNAGATAPEHTALIDYFMVAGLPPDTNSDATSPMISNIQTTVTDTTATITWDTNEVADSLIDYGLTSAYDSTVNNATLVTSHSLILTELTANTEYHYQISSIDGNANTDSSLDLTLTTNSNTPSDTTDTIIWDSNWNYRFSLTVNSGDYERFNRPVEVAIDFTNFLAPADLLTNFDVNSIRIHEVDVTGELLVTENIPFQFDQAEDFNALSNAQGTLVFLLGGNTTPQTDRYFQVYFDVEGGGHTAPIFTNQVNVTDNILDEGQSSFLINTLNADYYYQKQAGGFSSIIDNDQHDWINYHSTSAGLPGAASYFRGIPNLVHPEGHFHPGATSSISTLVHEGPLKATIKSITTDGWEVQWEFFPQFARMSVISAVDNYWFLYEGTPGGVLDTEDYVVRSNGTETPYTTAWSGDLLNQEWVYFSDTQVNKSIFLAHHNDDTGTDSYLQLNNQMTVFGFGRQNLNKTILPEPHQFTIGLTDSTDFVNTSTTIESAYKDTSVIISPVTHIDTISVSNIAPTVDAGVDQTIIFPSSVTLNALVSDDGLPAPSSVTTLWTVLSSPATSTVTFGDDSLVDTTVTFDLDGTYILDLSADDGDLSTNDQITITVDAAGGSNVAPTVDAGIDQTIILPNDATTLAGVVSDDGLPLAPGSVTALWTVISGPGTVTFVDDSLVDTSVRFSLAGDYVLDLVADDGDLTTNDQLTITVSTAVDSGDLLGHWELNDGSGVMASDSSGNGNNGTLINGPIWNGNKLLFDGINDYLNIGTLDIPGSALTLTGWVQTDDLENCSFRDCRILSKSTGTAEQDHFWMISTVKVGTTTRLRFRLKAGGVTSTLVASSGNINNGDVFHVAATYDGTTMRLYKDGVEVGSLAKTGAIDTNAAAEAWIGAAPTVASARPWDGSIADVRVYQTALTAAEVNIVKDSYDVGNIAPTVDAGIDQIITLPNDATLDATISDDSLPLPPGTVTTLWTVISGPGTVTFGDNSLVDTTVTFDLEGTYILDLSADDGDLTTHDQITIIVREAGGFGDLLGHWALNDGSGVIASDASGNNNDGTLINGPTWNGNELLFDGTDDYVNLGTLDVSGSALTLTSWVQTSNLENCPSLDCRILSKSTGTSEQDHFWMISTVKSGTTTRLRFRLKAGGVTSTLVASSGDISNGDVFHVAAVYDGITMRLYKDGIEVGSIAKTGAIDIDATVEAWIGAAPTVASARPWSGSLSNVRVYQKPLTLAEVITVMNVDKVADTTAPIISNRQVSTTGSNARITWTTNEAADSNVSYGTSNVYENGTISNGNSVVSHSVTLPGLTANTTYHYQLKSTDSSGNTATSIDFTFVTGAIGAEPELLMFDWNTVITEAERGFSRDLPPLASANGDWTSSINYADGELYLRAEITPGGQPVPQTMKFNFCVWQRDLVTENNNGLEACLHLSDPLVGNVGNTITWSEKISDMALISNDPLDWTRIRHSYGVAIKNTDGNPVSDYKDWNWFGEDPTEWYPLNMRFTVVVVPNGQPFSGWENYIN